MKVSVVIPNLNGEKYIKECLLSILRQDYSDFEVILVDNASTDKSVEVVRGMAEGKQVRIFENPENRGFSAAVNLGIEKSLGEYVLLFNNDAFAFSGFISELVNCMEKNPRAFAVQGAMIQFFDQTKMDDAGDYYNILGWACKRGDGLPVSKYMRQKRVFSACGGASLYRKDILQKIGLFDENFFAYLEDVDISFRANNAGYKCIYCPSAKAYHVASATSGSKYNAFKARCAGRNNIYLAYKNIPLVFLALNLLPLTIGYLTKMVFSSLKGHGKPFLKGTAEAFKGLSKLEKPRFRWNKLHCHLLMLLWMTADVFTYFIYRLRLLFLRDRKNDNEEGKEIS